jgi:hypothetical protein
MYQKRRLGKHALCNTAPDTGGCSNPIQDTCNSLPCCGRLWPFLNPGHGQTMARTGPSTTLYDCQAACYSCSMTLPHQPPYQILIVCSPGSALEEGAPHWHQDGRAPTRLPPFRPLPGCVETYSTSCLQSEALAAV